MHNLFFRRCRVQCATDPVLTFHSYNRYLAVAARAVRRSLKDGPRLAAERRGQSELRFAKWEVRIYTIFVLDCGGDGYNDWLYSANGFLA